MEAELNSETEIKENEPNNRPKAVRSASTFYIKLNHARVSMANPQFVSHEVEKKCAAEWKALGREGRKKYQDMSAEDKTRHTKEMEAELNSETEIKEKEPNRPLAARPAVQFCHKLDLERVSVAHPRITSIEVRKKCEAKWNALGSEGRKKYQDISAEDKTRHTKEMEAKLNSETEIRDNNFYYERNRDRVRMEHPCFSSVVRKKCDEDWKALSSVHRKLYQEMSAVDKTRHTKEMEAEKLNFETEIRDNNFCYEMGAEPNSETTYPMKTSNKPSVLAPIGVTTYPCAPPITSSMYFSF
jgi:hypothetical protein